jgi:predicted RNase H-like HicB family nuclease
MGVYFSVDVFRKDLETYVASCPELDIYAYGDSIENAVERLKRVVSFYMESAEEQGMTLEELGLSNSEEKNTVPRVSSVNLHAAIH